MLHMIRGSANVFKTILYNCVQLCENLFNKQRAHPLSSSRTLDQAMAELALATEKEGMLVM